MYHLIEMAYPMDDRVLHGIVVFSIIFFVIVFALWAHVNEKNYFKQLEEKERKKKERQARRVIDLRKQCRKNSSTPFGPQDRKMVVDYILNHPEVSGDEIIREFGISWSQLHDCLELVEKALEEKIED